MQIDRGPGRGLSQAPPGPGWAGKRPKIDDFRSYPPPRKNLKTILTALETSGHGHAAPFCMLLEQRLCLIELAGRLQAPARTGSVG